MACVSSCCDDGCLNRIQPLPPGFAQWPMEREQNEAFIAAQDAVGGQHRDAQGKRAFLIFQIWSRLAKHKT